MNVKQERICRLCLKLVRNEFAEIDEVIKKIFDYLLLKLDLNMTRDPIICQDCVEVTKNFLKFKLTLLSTEQLILSSSIGGRNGTHSIKVIYKEREDAETVIEERLEICRICMTRLERNNFTSLDNLSIEMTMFKVLSEYSPEVDFNIIENPMICTSCRRNLKDYINFMGSCMDTEGKIKSYCKTEGNETVDHVNLINVLNFLCKGILESPENCRQIYAVKEDGYIVEDEEQMYPETYTGFIKLEELDIKSSECKEKNNVNSDNVNSDNVNSDKMYKCSLCAYKTKYKGNLNRHIMSVHKNASEITMHKCSLCTYETKHKCCIKKHMLVHKDVSEIQIHKCSLCTYETKWKHDLKNHMIVHKASSEVHKCLICTYETKQKRSLKKHLSTHKNSKNSEIKMYTCSWCGYETNQRGTLEMHKLVHADVISKITHRCSLCTYEAKRKSNLKSHMFLHKMLPN